MATNKDPLALPAGDLRDTLTFMLRTIDTSVNPAVPIWTPGPSCRAKIDPLRGLELIRSGIDTSTEYLTISIRYRNDIDATMQIVFGTSTYRIENLENILQRNRVIRITAIGIGANI